MAKFGFVNFAWLFILLALSAASGPNVARAQVAQDERVLKLSPVKATKITVGVVEDVVLSPWNVSFPARIDTGADFSSLDAREIVVRNNVADFTLGKRFGGQRIQLPVIEWMQIQTATGTEKRPVVEVSICLGSKLFRTPVTLKDRSGMLYPFLVGRSALSGSFVVDPSLAKALPPACPASLASGSDPSQKSD